MQSGQRLTESMAERAGGKDTATESERQERERQTESEGERESEIDKQKKIGSRDDRDYA